MTPDKQSAHELIRQLDGRGTFTIDNFIISNIYNQCHEKLAILLLNCVILSFFRIPDHINGVLIIQLKNILQRTADGTNYQQGNLAVTRTMQSLSDNYTINTALC